MRIRAGSVALVVTLSALLSAPAFADTPSATQIVKGTFNRARRAVAVGPAVGLGLGYATSAGEMDTAVTFGLAFEYFKIPIVPTPEKIRAIIEERVKAKVKEIAKQRLLEGKPLPGPEDLERIGREIFEEVKAEVLGELSVRPKVLEKPRLAFVVEGAYFTTSEAWQLRTTVGVGISKVTIGPTLAVHLGDANGVLVGGELALHLLPKKSPRSPVIDLFLRADLGVTDGTAEADQVTLGARFLLDII